MGRWGVVQGVVKWVVGRSMGRSMGRRGVGGGATGFEDEEN